MDQGKCEEGPGRITIRAGIKEDAPFIGKTITEAMGRELCIGLAEGEENLPTVLRLFTELAGHPSTQYSFNNTLVAVNEKGEMAGAIVSYDGATHREMKKYFIEKANELLGWNVSFEEAETWEAETNGGEIYLDSLYVVPEFRNHGVASSLIKAAIERHREKGKPYGLLAEPHNENALRLYKKLGFREDGINCFCGEPMSHLTLQL